MNIYLRTKSSIIVCLLLACPADVWEARQVSASSMEKLLGHPNIESSFGDGSFQMVYTELGIDVWVSRNGIVEDVTKLKKNKQ